MSIAVRISGGGLKQGIHRGMSMNGQCLINESQDRRRWNSFQESNVCRTDSRILDCSRGSQRSYTKIHSTIDPAIGDGSSSNFLPSKTKLVSLIIAQTNFDELWSKRMKLFMIIIILFWGGCNVNNVSSTWRIHF